MSAARTLFLRDGELVKASLAVLKSDNFSKLVMYAMAEFTSLNPTTDQIIGVNRFLSTLRGMADSEEVEQAVIGPELTHDLDIKRKVLGEDTKPKE
jgi:hypothetical protein